jgi:RIO kinase 1
MSYWGDDSIAAPLLSEVRLQRDEAEPLFDKVLSNITLMLKHGLIHGDLSAYNILYWDGDITLIDFPQVVAAHSNRNAYAMLKRDVERICQYFAGQGLRRNAYELFKDLWYRYVEVNPLYKAADESRLLEAEE